MLIEDLHICHIHFLNLDNHYISPSLSISPSLMVEDSGGTEVGKDRGASEILCNDSAIVMVKHALSSLLFPFVTLAAIIKLHIISPNLT
ncbi:hypothetical protein Pcinc_002239 [Petrolisthes cinctipes]|uniref:Uncharacterized protein n=1 Tax=Petrolisthes cinctipes TaxID=88211 RepID=A0AAE1GLS7_PETCI|nr:hypothetical protein Pcinc_002239 [Petrolisthes cinctipes]